MEKTRYHMKVLIQIMFLFSMKDIEIHLKKGETVRLRYLFFDINLLKESIYVCAHKYLSL